MFRLTLFASLVMLSLTTLNAQKTQFKKGDLDLALGLGILPTFVVDGAKVQVPPVSLRLGYRVSDNFSLSAFTAYSSSSQVQPDILTDNTVRVENDFLMVGIRAAAHASRIENWDIYGGFSLGYNIPMVEKTLIVAEDAEPTRDDFDPHRHTRQAENNFTFSGFVGATYFFKEKNLGVFGELGYGVSILNVGVNFKL